MPRTRTPQLAAAVAAVLLLGPLVHAEPRPKEYDVRVRYQIDAFRNAHIVQYNEMVRYLDSVGLDREPEPEDAAESQQINRLNGTIPAADALKLLNERHVRALLLVPRGAKLPTADDPVRVDLQLTSFLTPLEVRELAGQVPTRPEDLAAAGGRLASQRLLAEQVRTVLRDFGFREAAGYDSRWHTRLVGMVPAGKLDALLDDLRKTPAGQKLGGPIQTAWPLRVVEVMTMVPFPVQAPVPLVPARGEERLTPELRMLLADEAAAARPVRMEVILRTTPVADDRAWERRLLGAAPGATLEGRLGPLVGLIAPAKQAVALAALPEVSTVRLPRSGEPRVVAGPTGKPDARAALKAAGLDRLHALGHRGRGLRLAIVDGDFRGWKGLVGKQLPAKTAFVDVTAERDRNLLPDAAPDEGNALGVGTQVAAAAALAAPEAQLTLIRIAPEAPYQLQEVARWISGENFLPLSLDVRYQELETDRTNLDVRQTELAREREALLALNVSLAPDVAQRPEKYGLDPQRDKELIARQAAFVKARRALDQDQKDFEGRSRRYVRLLQELRGLAGINIVASPLVWNEGFPVDGSSTLSRYFDERPFGGALWLQSAGDTRGQGWNGPFRDADGDGSLEFAPLGRPLPEGAWSPQLNFLGWEPAGKPRTADLPAGARVRVSVQWREAHDPEFFRDPTDPYRPSLANLNVVVLRQLDPSGKTRPRDDLEVVAQSVSLPQRLDNEPASATYEQTAEFTVKEAGRYVIRVEGHIPDDIRPPGVPTLPILKRAGEVRPRVFVRTLAGPGRAVFVDYAPAVGDLGMPADARCVITVGAANLENRAEPFSAAGSPADLELLHKPDVLAYDVLLRAAGEASGTSVATGFAAGLAAAACSRGAPRSRFLGAMQALPGGVLRVPPDLR